MATGYWVGLKFKEKIISYKGGCGVVKEFPAFTEQGARRFAEYETEKIKNRSSRELDSIPIKIPWEVDFLDDWESENK